MTITSSTFENIPYEKVECELYVRNRAQYYKLLLMNMYFTRCATVQVIRHLCLCTILSKRLMLLWKLFF